MIEWNYYNEDCIEGCKSHIPDNSVDLIITDPPYGISGDKLDAHYNRDESYVIGGYVDIPAEKYGEFSYAWIHEAERILKPGGTLYIVSGYTNLHHILNALHATTSLKEINHLIWKYNFGVYTSRKYISSHYHILYWVKTGAKATFNTYCRYGDSEKEGNASLNYLDREDVLIINREYKPNEIKNKNELPRALLTKLIQYSSNSGDVVCDLFLGGFSTAIVAKGLGRLSTGFEISQSAYTLGMGRISQVNEGELIPTLRVPSANKITKSGKWSDDEITQVKEICFKMENESKKKIIAEICEMTGRGRWGVEKMLDTIGYNVTSRGKKTGIKGNENIIS